MKSILFLTLLALPSLTIAGALAQDTDSQQATSLRKDAPAPRDPTSVRFVHHLGMCAAKSVSNYSRDVLRRLPESSAANKSLFWVATLSNSCVKNEEKLRFSPRFLRGVVAEYYVSRDFEVPSGKAKRKPLAVYPNPTSAELDKEDAHIKAAVAMVEIGTCAAKANPAGVSVLFASEPTSVEETSAMNALLPALAECASPTANLKISKFQMRGFIAEGAYRAMASAQSEPN